MIGIWKLEQLANPVYLAGKTAYFEGIPSAAINHCSPDVATAWLAGWHDARAEHLLLRAQSTGNRGDFSGQRRRSVL